MSTKSKTLLAHCGILFILCTSLYPEPPKLEKDMAKNIQAKVLEDGFSIQLTWTPPEEDGEIIIGRSKERIDTPEKLYYADSLGRYPNKGENKMSSFKDINLKPGVYYYAVIMVSRVKKRDVVLVPDQNYTYHPIDIGQPVQIIKLGKNEILPYAHDSSKSVTDIEVKTFKDYNQIRWVHPLNAENTKPTYHLYRSEEPLSSIPLMKEARKIVELKYPDNFYVDKNIEKGKIYYYGVSVSIQGEEFIPLVEHKSFIRTVYAIPPKEEPKQEKSQVVVTTTSPEKPTVLESSKREEISVPVKLEVKEESKKEVPAREIAVKPQTEIKKEEQPKEVVVTIKPQVETKPEESKKLQEVKSHVQDINYEYRGEGIFLTWVAPEDAIRYATVYSVYLFNSFPKNPEKALEEKKGVKIGEVVHPEMSFFIPKIDRKRAVYLAVSVKHGKDKEQMNFVLDESLLKVEPEKELSHKSEETEVEPKETQKEENNNKPQETTTSISSKKETNNHAEEISKETETKKPKKESLELDQILTEYYKKKKYEKARSLLDKYSQRETQSELRAKALFYSALCDYNLGNYERSLNKLLQKEIKNFNEQERVDFYINRCTEKTKK